jgi:hypothetical protein
MSVYSPDAWVIVELSGKKVENRYHRILAGWYGGYIGMNQWKLSSGLTKIIDKDKYWQMHNESGSIYNCPKPCERTTALTASIFETYSNANNDDIAMKIVDFDDIKDQYETDN